MISRHHRGRGLVLDNGDVNLTSYVSKDSIVQGNASVRDARLLNASCVDEDAQVFGGVLDQAYVGGRTIVAGNAFLGEQTIARCCSITGNARVTRSRIEGVVRIYDDAVVDQVRLFDGLMVYGTARLYGPWQLGGFSRLHEGVWYRPPRYVELDHAVITECVDNRLLIECKCKPKTWWLRFGTAFGRRQGWTDEQIAITFDAVENFSRVAVEPLYGFDPEILALAGKDLSGST